MTNIEVQMYYQNEIRSNGVYSRDNLSKNIKDGAYVTNIDDYGDVGTHWVALYSLNNNIIYFVRSEIEHIITEIKKCIGNKNIKDKHI